MNGEEFEHPLEAKEKENLGGGKVTGETENMVAKIDKSLAALATVRKPGKGKLSLSEAIATVIEQAEAYEQWRQFGAPVGMFDVWVEAQKVMTVQPGDVTELKGVLFELASLPKSVVQVVRRADEVVDTVVLLNGELQEISTKGVKFVQSHPNNQEITLEVKPEENGQLRLWLGFNPVGVRSVDDSRPLERLKSKAASAKATFHRQLQWLKRPWAIPAFGTAAFAVLAMLTVIPLLSRRQAVALGGVKPPPATKGIAATIVVDSSLSLNVDGLNKVGVAIALIMAKQVTVGNQIGGDGAKKLQPRVRLKPVRVDVPIPREDSVLEDNSTAPGASLAGVPEEEDTAETFSWEAQRLRRLAEVQTVFLLMNNSTQMHKAQVKELLAAVGSALKETGIAVVTTEAKKEQADGIMIVRFEPDTTYFGAIFATMRDRKGNFLWQEHASCRALRSNEWSAIFDDASTRLIDKLPSRPVITPRNTAAQEQAVATME
ncbi:MAG TPA: hypothetical protein VGX92_09070 [Pyrinomonadaceae bacterium]|jgi:hypothetical protein|nr:hypothetical protein [Pyrinomonadaceae bacterium]